MNFKNILKPTLLAFFTLACVGGCKKWTEVEPYAPINKNITYHETEEDSEYYKALRAFKQTPHEVSFTWYSEWTGQGSLQNCMRGLPDSIDIVSMWGGWKNPGPERLADLRFCQEKKGIKALTVFVVMDIGDQITPDSVMPWVTNPDYSKLSRDAQFAETVKAKKEFWGWEDNNMEKVLAATEKYAMALVDTIDKYGYDGFDLDWEVGYAQPFSTQKNLNWYGGAPIAKLVETMSKHIGPRSGTGRLFVIDGEPYLMPDTLANCFDYYITQAYSSSDYTQLQHRLDKVINAFRNSKNVDGTPMTPEQIAAKFIVTENFEAHGLSGGPTFKTQSGERVPSLLGMAMWQPQINGKSVRKGGCGSFRTGFEYRLKGFPLNVTYPRTRESIQIMNPAVR